MSRYDGTPIKLTPQCAACPFFFARGSREEGALRARVTAAVRIAPTADGICTWGVALKAVWGPAGRACSKDQANPPGRRIWPARGENRLRFLGASSLDRSSGGTGGAS